MRNTTAFNGFILRQALELHHLDHTQIPETETKNSEKPVDSVTLIGAAELTAYTVAQENRMKTITPLSSGQALAVCR